MLGRLQSTSRGSLADFSDMAEAVEAICAGGGRGEGGAVKQSVEISDDHQVKHLCNVLEIGNYFYGKTFCFQLVLACAWLNLKECCLLSSALVSESELSESSPPSSNALSVSPSDARRCCDVVAEVLTRCRHKGAILSAQGALQDMSARSEKRRFEFRFIQVFYVSFDVLL